MYCVANFNELVNYLIHELINLVILIKIQGSCPFIDALPNTQ